MAHPSNAKVLVVAEKEALSEEPADNVAWGGDNRGCKLEWAQLKAEALEINGAQVLVASQKHGASEGGSFGEDVSVVALGQIHADVRVSGEDLGRLQIHGQMQAAWRDPATAGAPLLSACSCADGTSPRSSCRPSSLPQVSRAVSYMVYPIGAGRCRTGNARRARRSGAIRSRLARTPNGKVKR